MSGADDAGVRDLGDPEEDLIRLNDDAVTAVDPLAPIPERRIDAGLPQIGRFEHKVRDRA